MKSRTKYELDDKTVKGLFEKAGLGKAIETAPLGLGMFNSAYGIVSDTGEEYVMKIAPKNDLPVMTYEKDMLKTELYWYGVLAENTDIALPKIYFEDFSCKDIHANWFLMEKVSGVHRNKFETDAAEKNKISVEMICKMHKIKNGKFGYIQNTLYENWYEAYRSIVMALVDDAQRMGKHCKNGERLIPYIDQYKEILAKAECTLVNFDLWDTNLLCENRGGKIVFTLIDPERSFWGDPIFDFICLGGFFDTLDKKKEYIELYNSYADVEVELNRESKIRYAFAQALMALIQEVERYYRFPIFSEGWMLNTFAYKKGFKVAFEALENEK